MKIIIHHRSAWMECKSPKDWCVAQEDVKTPGFVGRKALLTLREENRSKLRHADTEVKYDKTGVFTPVW